MKGVKKAISLFFFFFFFPFFLSTATRVGLKYFVEASDTIRERLRLSVSCPISKARSGLAEAGRHVFRQKGQTAQGVRRGEKKKEKEKKFHGADVCMENDIFSRTGKASLEERPR